MPTVPLKTDVSQTIVDALDEGRRFALALVLRSAGSVPREAGAAALIERSGAIYGTIGGGLLEAEAQRRAIEAMRTMRPDVFDFRFAGASAVLNDPVCGGTMRILVDPTVASHRQAYIEAAAAARRRQRGVLVTSVVADDTPTVRVEWFAEEAVPPPDEGAATAMRAALSRGRAQVFGAALDSVAATEGLAEPVAPAARLLIAGGGHVGQALAAQATMVGFEVIVVEDRAEFANETLYPPSVTARFGNFADILDDFPIDQDTYVAIVGRGHPVDMKALVACIDKPAAYIGMMGSRRKVALVRKALLESGRVTAEQFARVYAPIGMNLGAETVPEIAASIVAQLVAVRRTGRAPRFD